MAITVKNLIAPYVAAIGNRVSADGHTSWHHDRIANQAIPGGTPTSVTNTDPYVFSKWVYFLCWTGDIDVPPVDLLDYGPHGDAPIMPVNGLFNAYGMLPENEHGAGNVLYTFGPGRTLSPTESYFMTGWGALLLLPNTPYPSYLIDEVGPVVPTYVFADDVIEMTSAVFAQGRVGDRTVIRFRIV